MQVHTWYDAPPSACGQIDDFFCFSGRQGDFVYLWGWARSPALRKPSDLVLIVDAEHNVLAETCPQTPRADVANYYEDPSMTVCGWCVFIDASILPHTQIELSAYDADAGIPIAYRLGGNVFLAAGWKERLGSGAGTPIVRPPDRAANFALNEQERLDGISVLASAPVQLMLELTSRCNLDCLMCYRHGAAVPPVDMPSEVYTAVKESLFPLAARVCFTGGGEPAMHPLWDRILEDVQRAGLSIELTTNGTRLGESNIRSLVDADAEVNFSVDGATSRTYEFIRGTSLSIVEGSVARMRTYGQETGRYARMSLVFTPTLANLWELPDLVDLAASWGVPWVRVQPYVPSAHTLSWSPAANPVFTNAMYSKATTRAIAKDICLTIYEEVKSNRHPPIRNQPMQTRTACCIPAFSECLIKLDGDVRPCCWGAPTMGNLNHQDFEGIWNGERWQALRTAMIAGDPAECCRNCHMLPCDAGTVHGNRLL